jgi:uncharacterized membrane protein
MASVPTPPAPGSMTVSMMFGWQTIATVVTLLVVVAVVFLLIGSVSRSATGRSEWQAWLDARSGRHDDPATDPQD